MEKGIDLGTFLKKLLTFITMLPSIYGENFQEVYMEKCNTSNRKDWKTNSFKSHGSFEHGSFPQVLKFRGMIIPQLDI